MIMYCSPQDFINIILHIFVNLHNFIQYCWLGGLVRYVQQFVCVPTRAPIRNKTVLGNSRYDMN